MTIKVNKEQQILQEGLETLMNHLELSKVVHFVAACHLGEEDYLKLKDKLFEQETVASLYDLIKAYEDQNV